jgi:hypothetical protein
MAQFEIIGDQQKLSKGPKSMDRSRFTGGSFQQVGDRVQMSAKPVPLQHDSKGVRGGTFQEVGDRVSLERSPQKGWESYSTPISDRSWFQSATSGRGGKKKK